MEVVKHTKSNAIVLTKDHADSRRWAGADQPDYRAGAGDQIRRRQRQRVSDDGVGCVIPLSDCVEAAHKAGIGMIIQPGGSIRDQESIDACDKYGIAMVFTGMRHFRHKEKEWESMKVLVVGGGGREHAIIWKLAQSEKVDKIYAAPGNGGIAQLAECVPIGAMDLDGMVAFAKENQVDLTVVAPDDPLAAGMVDRLEAAGLRAFGPSAKAAQIESSKVLCQRIDAKIPHSHCTL